MTCPRAWLPDGVVDLPRVRIALDPVVQPWAKRWLKTGSVVIAFPNSASPARSAESAASGELRQKGPSAEIYCSARTKRSLLEAIIGETLGNEALGPEDWRLLDELAVCALSDLLSGFALDDTEQPLGARRMVLSVSGREVATLRCSDELLISRIRANLRPRATGYPALRLRSAASSLASIELFGRLGELSLTLDEVKGLSAGDVLVLDKSLDDPVELVSKACGHVIRKARLGAGERYPVLHL